MVTILNAEDIEINREVLYLLLGNTGIHLISAENGRIALDLFIKKPEMFDIVLTDINMPKMDGYKLAREIRSKQGWGKDIPIIALTAHSAEKDIEKCFAAGMNDHIKKPINLPELKSKLKKHLPSHMVVL